MIVAKFAQYKASTVKTLYNIYRGFVFQNF